MSAENQRLDRSPVQKPTDLVVVSVFGRVKFDAFAVASHVSAADIRAIGCAVRTTCARGALGRVAVEPDQFWVCGGCVLGSLVM